MAEDNNGDKFVYFLIGAGMGAIAALLFAPKAGSELRADIADVTRRSADQARDQARQLGERASEYYHASADYATELAERGKEAITDVTERSKDIINRQKASVAAAIEAGKQGYREAKLNDIAKSGAASGAAYDEN
ncbi:MAG TPA: YtxH domain-containing protein [Blastocatellia bacterium]|nr:YtxH domain-containing protein [Blastocatellia bacterium]